MNVLTGLKQVIHIHLKIERDLYDKKAVFTMFPVFCLMLLTGTGVKAEETITLTTYYPAPYGEYDSLSVGSDYTASTTDGTLTVEGRIGIGTASPNAKLEIVPDTAIVPGMFYEAIRLSHGTGTAINFPDLNMLLGSCSVGPIGLYWYDTSTATVLMLLNRTTLIRNGNMQVTGTLTKTAGSFLIDHPLDPENKILRHSFVESPDMKNIYDGTITLDKNGEAVVILPDYFEALNKDFRYQLTAMGAPAPSLHIKDGVKNNSFTIAGGRPNQQISWQITGTRCDRYAVKNPIIVEEVKGEGNDYKKGEFLYNEKSS
ncbi:MAG: hypothetical protein PHV77_02050 [Candidatus Omnitrophica bacterium]|nr:hypothetical protein [Candidatus Omnitrophota bacterium]